MTIMNLKNFLIFFLLVAVMFAEVHLSSSKHAQCPFPLHNKVTWCHRIDDYCYEFMGKAPYANWTAAAAACESIGSQLPMFKTSKNYESFSQLSYNRTIVVLEFRELWGYEKYDVVPIGLRFDSVNFDKTNKINGHEGWKWIDGSAVGFQNWGTDSPDHHGQTIYAYDHGFWFDATESNKYLSTPICQKKCANDPQCVIGYGSLVPAANPDGGIVNDKPIKCEFACYALDTCDVTLSFFGDCQEFNNGSVHVGGLAGVPPMEKMDSFRFCKWARLLTKEQRSLVHFQASKMNKDRFILSEFHKHLDGWGCGDPCMTSGTSTIIAWIGKISKNKKDNSG